MAARAIGAVGQLARTKKGPWGFRRGLHRPVVLTRRRLALALGAGRRLGGVLRQHGREALKQARFVGVAQGELTVAPVNRQMDIDTGRGFGQGSGTAARGLRAPGSLSGHGSTGRAGSSACTRLAMPAAIR